MQVLGSRDSRLARDRHSQRESLECETSTERPLALGPRSPLLHEPGLPSDRQRVVERSLGQGEYVRRVFTRFHTAVAVAVRGISLSRRAPLVRIGDCLRVTSE